MSPGPAPGNSRATPPDAIFRDAAGIAICFQGLTMTLRDWAAEMELPERTIRARIRRGLPVIEVLRLPPCERLLGEPVGS